MVLPSLDTSDISFIAYWNFLDNGGGSIDPTEAISAMETYEEYSNGVDGTISVSFGNKSSRLANCRVKDDGWIICWFDRSLTFDTLVTDRDRLVGDYDILNDWTASSALDLQQNNLERSVNTLRQSLTGAGSTTYNPSDVSLYWYRFPDATTITFDTTSVDGETSQTVQTEILAGTDLQAYWFIASQASNGNSVWNGITVTDNNVTTPNLGALDAINQGGATTGEQYSSSTVADPFGDVAWHEMIAWS